jgi:hypothetical protein
MTSLGAQKTITATLVEHSNLALRKTVHQLWQLEGNDSLTIDVVQEENGKVFSIQLSQGFNYDTLPWILHRSLENYGLAEEAYLLTVFKCGKEEIILGYNSEDFKKGEVPCVGREQYSQCNIIKLTFPERKEGTTIFQNILYLLGILLILYAGVEIARIIGRRRLNKKKLEEKRQEELANSRSYILRIGNSQLFPDNQLILINGEEKELTYRENKLLLFLARHANQLLKREVILNKVWGEEGIKVGRSLDVFISRLRKILRADNKIAIRSVHGVGYRLEVIE